MGRAALGGIDRAIDRHIAGLLDRGRGTVSVLVGLMARRETHAREENPSLERTGWFSVKVVC